MSTIKCPRCGLVNWSSQSNCNRCGIDLEGRGGNFATESRAYAEYSDPVYNVVPSHAKAKSGLATASMVLGIISFVAGCMGGFLLAPIGLILGIVSLVKVKKLPLEYGGQGQAIAGVIMSSLGVLMIPIVAAIAIPNLLAARRAANEGSAIANLRQLAQAESRFMSTTSGTCGDLQSLIKANLVDGSLSDGKKSGYQFIIVSSPEGDCQLNAVPLVGVGISATGTRSFFLSSHDNWTIRAAEKKGRPANILDKPLPTH